ncbi:MAG: MauE/DoxX family redox-associated membrane protein [Bacteroidota bacterium]
MEVSLKKKINRLLLVGFFLFAGFNHFRDPEFYYPLIPDYLPYPYLINIVSGIAEMILALAILSPKTRKIAAFLMIAMLISFIPSHVYFIQIGSCVTEGLCVPAWIAWVRLIIIHPLLIWWVYVNR